MQKIIVVTGACGFIGRHTARLAAERNYHVLGIGHGKWSQDQWESWGLASWHESDIDIENLVQCCPEKPYAIIHFAGGSSVPLSMTEPFEDFKRTVQTTAQVLEYVRTQSPLTRVVYCSSASVYGAVTSTPIKEESAAKPISPYGVHKYMAEQLVTSYSRQYLIASSIVRLFSVYGAGLRKQLLWDACRKIATGDLCFMGTGNEARDWLHVEDAANLMLSAAENSSPDSEIVNGGSGKSVSVREIVRHLSKELSPGSEEPIFSGETRTGDPTCLVADIGRAGRWGWLPKRPLTQGLAQYAAWWLQEEDHDSTVRTEDRTSATSALSSRHGRP
jgi:UDP-glucose 4-epimerase